MSKLELMKIGVDDERLSVKNKNSLVEKITAQPGIKVSETEVNISPSQYFHKEAFATVTLTSEQFIELLNAGIISVICESDPTDSNLPEIGQRIPTADRRRMIRLAWADKNRTPQNKRETLEMAAFGVRSESKKGLVFDEKSVLVITDGAGRASAALDEIAENGGKLLLDKNLLWQINVDLSADIVRQMMLFLSHNRDPKRTNKGTVSAVENAIIGDMEGKRNFKAPANFKEKLATTYVVRHIYQDFDKTGSLTELFPWAYEGRTSTSNEFTADGRASNLSTAIAAHKDLIDRIGFTPEELPAILDFGFRAWSRNCQKSINDIKRDYLDKEYKTKLRLHTTLGLKVVILLTLRCYKESKGDEAKFVDLCNKVFALHYATGKNDDYTNAMLKKMDMDRFWETSKWFSEDGRFNSGLVNTQNILKKLNSFCDMVVGTLPTKQKAKRKAKAA